MPSLRYAVLTEQVAQLAKALLPRDMSKPAFQHLRNRSIRALAYRVLCHAEIESYFEDRSLEIAKAIDLAWKSKAHISRSTLSILGFSGRKLESLPASLSAPPNKKQVDWDDLLKLDGKLSQSVTRYYKGVTMSNHGIKEANLISMLLPVGFDPAKFDPLFITELNNFSTKRGEAAHKTIKGQLTIMVDPKDEFDQVQRILSGIVQIDLELDYLLSSAR
jgi:hypothetical protein